MDYSNAQSAVHNDEILGIIIYGCIQFADWSMLSSNAGFWFKPMQVTPMLGTKLSETSSTMIILVRDFNGELFTIQSSDAKIWSNYSDVAKNELFTGAGVTDMAVLGDTLLMVGEAGLMTIGN